MISVDDWRRLSARATRPALWTLYDQLLVSGANFLINVLAARHLGVSAYGQYALAMLSVLMLNNFHRALLTQPLNVLGAAEGGDAVAQRLRSLLIAQIASIVFVGPVLSLAAWAFFPDIRMALAAIVTVFAWQAQEVLRRYLYTVSDHKKVVGLDLVGYGGGLVGVVVATQTMTLAGWHILLVLGAAFCLSFVVGLVLLRGALMPSWSFLAARRVALEHWQFGRWLALSVVAIWIANQSYPFILNSFAGAAAVGLYMASRSLLNGTSVLVQASNSHLPGRAKTVLSTGGKEALSLYLRNNTRLIALAAGIFCALVVAFPVPILHVVFGPDFIGSADVLRVLALGTYVATVSVVATAGLTALGQTKEIFKTQATSAVVTVVLGVPLVYGWGALGAAIGFSLGFVVVYFQQVTALKRAIKHV